MSSPTLSPDPLPPPSASSTEFTFGGYVDESGLVGAGFWIRAAARMIDQAVHLFMIMVSGAMFYFIVGMVGAMADRNVETFGDRAFESPLFILASIVGAICYHTICEGFHGSSLGKLLLGLQVLGTNRKPCTLRSALVRSLGFYIDGLFFGAIGYLPMQKSILMQRNGDVWGDTVVCRRKTLSTELKGSLGKFAAAFIIATGVDCCVVVGYCAVASTVL